MRKGWSQEIRVQSCLAINLLFEHIKYNKKIAVYLLEHYMAEPLRPNDLSLSHITDANVVWKWQNLSQLKQIAKAIEQTTLACKSKLSASDL